LWPFVGQRLKEQGEELSISGNLRSLKHRMTSNGKSQWLDFYFIFIYCIKDGKLQFPHGAWATTHASLP
jgi:hypothetical protein